VRPRQRGEELLGKLADRGEQAISGVADLPGADRILGLANEMRERVDELQRRIRGLDALEPRIAELERRVAELEGERAASPPAARPEAG
jgi:polyhydroxyalkanoate synthesis regulator phasin